MEGLLIALAAVEALGIALIWTAIARHVVERRNYRVQQVGSLTLTPIKGKKG